MPRQRRRTTRITSLGKGAGVTSVGAVAEIAAAEEKGAAAVSVAAEVEDEESEESASSTRATGTAGVAEDVKAVGAPIIAESAIATKFQPPRG
jgi:hypothetical protein